MVCLVLMYTVAALSTWGKLRTRTKTKVTFPFRREKFRWQESSEWIGTKMWKICIKYSNLLHNNLYNDKIYEFLEHWNKQHLSSSDLYWIARFNVLPNNCRLQWLIKLHTPHIFYAKNILRHWHMPAKNIQNIWINLFNLHVFSTKL